MVEDTRSIHIIIQARTTSSRLPAKMLLPIKTYFLAELVAKRASRNGGSVTVATSIETSDDMLADKLINAGVRVYRGSLNNVLDRFIGALKQARDEDICVRLTADNLFPDADFIDEIIQKFTDGALQYVSYGNNGYWLPYGLSAEVFLVGDLREAHASTNDPFDVEHVTPYLKRKYQTAISPNLQWSNGNLGGFRCTIDNLEDYLKISSIFEKTDDPVQIKWSDLVNNLAAIAPAKEPNLVLGTVQVGLSYGIKKNDPLMDVNEAFDILESAKAYNVSCLDTARAYGKSEARIGQFMTSNSEYTPLVITKLDPMTKLSPSASNNEIKEKVNESLKQSSQNLQKKTLPVVMLHRAEQLHQFDGQIWNELLHAKEHGLITDLGVSIQTPDELSAALEFQDIKYIQMPYNILDRRYDHLIPKIIERLDLTVHVRSIFLQGILLQTNTSNWPNIHGLDSDKYLSAIQQFALEMGRKNTADLCLSFVRSMSWIDGIVIGVDTKQHLDEISKLFKNKKLNWKQTNTIMSSFSNCPIKLLNPALW